MPRPERPLEAEQNPLTAFAGELRRLRERAGNPGYRELARRAHYAASTLSVAAAGRSLPSLAVTSAFVAACGGDVAEWERKWREVAAEIGPPDGVQPADDESPPYAGLATFQPEDADRFFGRDALVAELLDRVRQRRFVAVFGPSGCGKSSVLRAGLTARLRADPAAGPVLVLTPGRRPAGELAVRLAELLEVPPADPAVLIYHPAAAGLVVVVDQFEETFTVCDDPAERDRFVDLLSTVATAIPGRFRVVLGMRADFYGHCARYPRLVEALRDAQILVAPMTVDELRQAVTQPAENAGLRLETALVARVVADATGQAGVLPLVSHALLETWRRRRGTTLTLAGYEAAGGIQEALRHSAEAVYRRLDDPQRRTARQIFLRLTALGDGTEDTKRRLDRAELDGSEPGGNPDTAVVLDELAAARLVIVDRDSVELAHEALIRHWPRLSPDGHTFATLAEEGKAIQLWHLDAANDAEKRATLPLSGLHLNLSFTPFAAFSPDGRLLVTVGAGQLWDVADPGRPRALGALRAATADVESVAFSRDGQTIATGGADHTIRLWDTSLDAIADRICALAHPRITRQDWDRYFPSLDYRPPCP